MANEKNLIPQAHKLTVEEQSAGGKRSGEVRREKKLFRELAQEVLSLQTTDESILDIAKSFGIENPDNKALVILGLLRAAIDGSHHAFDRLYELTGEKTDNSNESVMNKLDKVIGEVDKIAK